MPLAPVQHSTAEKRRGEKTGLERRFAARERKLAWLRLYVILLCFFFFSLRRDYDGGDCAVGECCAVAWRIPRWWRIATECDAVEDIGSFAGSADPRNHCASA